MCGIIGYKGRSNAIPLVIHGLKNLEYRGYDSSGIAYFNNGKINIYKKEGKIVNLEEILWKIIFMMKMNMMKNLKNL